MFSQKFWLIACLVFAGLAAMLAGSRRVALAGVQTPVTCTESDVVTRALSYSQVSCSPTPAPQQVCANNVVVGHTYCPGTSIATPNNCPPPYVYAEHYGSEPPVAACGQMTQCVDGGYMPSVIGCPEDSTGTVSVTVQVVDQTGQPVAGAQLAGNAFVLAGQDGGISLNGSTNASGQVTFALVTTGNYILTEQAAAGATFASMTVNGAGVAPTQTFQVQPGKTYAVTVTNTSSPASGN
jgi:hypothetical protein